jgi:hypothetical protein
MEKDCDNRVWFTFNLISANAGIVIADSEDSFFQITKDNSELYDDKVYDLNYNGQVMWVGVKNGLQKVDFSGGCQAISMVTEELNVQDFELYPNPSNGNFTIVVEESSKVEIYSVEGRLCYSQLLTKGVNQIEMENVKGIYLAYFVSAKGDSFVKRIILNK